MFHVPDTVHTAAVREITAHLSSLGSIVMAGGAARDMWHFNPPRDLDLWVLGYIPPEQASLHLQDLPGVTNVVACLSSGDTQVNRPELDYVLKFEYAGLRFDLIQHGSNPDNVRDVCMTFDLNINQAWLDVSGQYNIVRVAPGYPSLSEGLPVTLVSLRACNANRVGYIMQKYPNYWYKIKSEELQ